MSHFSVAVIMKDLSELDNLMLPYISECTGCCPPEYLEFCDETDILREEYESDDSIINIVDFGNGKICSLTDESLLKNTNGEEDRLGDEMEAKGYPWKTMSVYENGVMVNKYYDYTGGTIREGTYKELYATFEEYVESLGIDYDENNGGYGYSTNPNGKWDGYRVGGRYRGLLKASDGEHASPAAWEHDISIEDGFYDIAQIKNIDFRFDVDRYSDAKKEWEIMFEGAPHYHMSEDDYRMLMCQAGFVEHRYGTKEVYDLERSTMTTDAVITPDGNWHEVGGGNYGEETQEGLKKWIEEYYSRFFKEQDKEYYVAIVDCHI